MTVMNCTSCHVDVPSDSAFCPNCGTQLASPQGNEGPPTWVKSPDTTSTVAVRQPQTGEVSETTKWVVIVATILVPLVGFIMGAVYRFGKDPMKHSVGRTWLIVGGVAFMVQFVLLAGA